MIYAATRTAIVDAMSESIEPLNDCDIRGCDGVAGWLYVLDGDVIRLCTRHWEVIEEGPILDAE